MGQHIKVVERGFHRTQKHELAQTLKQLMAAAPEAIKTYLHLMANSKDEKIQKSCADSILEYQRQFAKEVNDDQMQRLIANIKFGGPKQLGTEGDEDDDTPELDFTEVVEMD